MLGILSDRASWPLSDADWSSVIWQASHHLVAPGLYPALEAAGRLSEIPAEPRDALEGLCLLNRERNRVLQSILRDTAVCLNAAGVMPLLLKGAVALLPDQYPGAFDRIVGDLDLYVPADLLHTSVAALREAGFTDPEQDFGDWDWDACHHAAPLCHPSGQAYVELHRGLGGRMPWLTADAMWEGSSILDWKGSRVRVPSLEHRLLHNALHDQVQDWGFVRREVRLRQLLEFERLQALPQAREVDWKGWLTRLDEAGAGDAVRVYLLLGHRLFGAPLPEDVRITRQARWSAYLTWLGLERSQMRPVLTGAEHAMGRLRRLPRRLATPAWYGEKYRYWRGRLDAAVSGDAGAKD